MIRNQRFVRAAYYVTVVLLAGVPLVRIAWGFVASPSEDLSVTDSSPMNHVVGGRLPNVFIASYPMTRSYDQGKADSVRLAELVPKGRCAVIIFYSAACGWCHRAAAAWREEAAQTEVAGALRWISIDQNPALSVPFVAEYSITEPRYLLRTPNDADTLGVTYTPSAYVVNDKLGVLRRPGPGPEDLLRPPAQSAVAAGYEACDPAWAKKEPVR